MSETSPAIVFTKVTRRFATAEGGTYTALDNVNLTVRRGEFLSIVGPTGCGKSTLLNIAAGLLAADSGSVSVFGEPLTGLNRFAAYQFQSDVLLPWKTALENTMLGLLFRQVSRAEAEEKVRNWLKRVGLTGFEDRYPHQLSGGMRKRVALAQALIVEPAILLMDESFSALDQQTKAFMEDDLLALCADDSKTVLFVTHDLQEAIGMADRVVILSAGPGTRIVGDFSVDIPRPRNMADIRVSPAFRTIYEQLWTILRSEVMRAYGKQQRDNHPPVLKP